MIGTDARAFGADDAAGGSCPGKGLRKLRFLMIDNTEGHALLCTLSALLALSLTLIAAPTGLHHISSAIGACHCEISC